MTQCFRGFWVDRGTANKEAAKLIETLTNPNVVFFATLGMYAILITLVKVLKKHLNYCKTKKSLVDGFICQGKIDPKVIEMMYKMSPPGSAHGQKPWTRCALHKAAETHPDEQDFANAKELLKSVLCKVASPNWKGIGYEFSKFLWIHSGETTQSTTRV